MKNQLIEKCPITNTDDKIVYFTLGEMPLVNNLCNTREESLEAKRYKLEIQYFRKSKLTSITETVDPMILFGEYAYKSGVVKAYSEHCKDMYDYLNSILKFKSSDNILDVGGNDGTLLFTFLQKNTNLTVLNVDASKNVCVLSEARGIKTYNAFWGVDTAKKLDKKFKLITSTNVFQHTAPIADYTEAVSMSLTDDGIWCLEFPYWKTTMETNQFDQIYHEHVYFYLLTPLKLLFEKYGLEIFRVGRHSIHGGTLRLLIAKRDKYIVETEVNKILLDEQNIPESYYQNWGHKITDHIKNCREFLLNLKKNGANIVGFGAAAKGCIFLNSAKIDYKIIDAVIDDTDLKQNKYIPGTGIKIVNREYLKNNNVDYMVLLAHNFKDAIIDSLKEEYNGKYIILFPEPKIF